MTQKQFRLFYQVFRHGDHTPQEFFPTDNHKEIARQEGYGQLTKVSLFTWGKNRTTGRLYADIWGLELCFHLEKAFIKLPFKIS